MFSTGTVCTSVGEKESNLRMWMYNQDIEKSQCSCWNLITAAYQFSGWRTCELQCPTFINKKHQGRNQFRSTCCGQSLWWNILVFYDPVWFMHLVPSVLQPAADDHMKDLLLQFHSGLSCSPIILPQSWALKQLCFDQAGRWSPGHRDRELYSHRIQPFINFPDLRKLPPSEDLKFDDWNLQSF